MKTAFAIIAAALAGAAIYFLLTPQTVEPEPPAAWQFYQIAGQQTPAAYVFNSSTGALYFVAVSREGETIAKLVWTP